MRRPPRRTGTLQTPLMTFSDRCEHGIQWYLVRPGERLRSREGTMHGMFSYFASLLFLSLFPLYSPSSAYHFYPDVTITIQRRLAEGGTETTDAFPCNTLHIPGSSCFIMHLCFLVGQQIRTRHFHRNNLLPRHSTTPGTIHPWHLFPHPCVAPSAPICGLYRNNTHVKLSATRL